MSSQQNAHAIVQQVSDRWELHAAMIAKLTPQIVSLSHMSALLPLVSPEVIIFQCFISSLQTALLIYDILLRLRYEVKHIWQRKFRLGTILYLLAQYSVVVIPIGQSIKFPTIKVGIIGHVMYWAYNMSSKVYMSSGIQSHVRTGDVMTGFTFLTVQLF